MLELNVPVIRKKRPSELRPIRQVLFFDAMSILKRAKLPIHFTAMACFFVGHGAAFAADEIDDGAESAVSEDDAAGQVDVPADADPELQTESTVAEGDDAATDPVESVPASRQAERLRAHEQFLFMYDRERFAEATEIGMKVVELTREEFGGDDMRMASPLVNLAIAQTKTGDYGSAEANFQESIRIIENHEGVLSPRLINPLSGLGSAYNKAGLYERGATTLERALLLNHVNEGLYNFEQFKIQDGLTDSYMGMNSLEDATFYQKSQVEIHERKLGANDPGVATALYKLARWYEQINNVEDAMLMYRRADRLLRKAGGDSNPARVDALRGVAIVHERQGLPSSAASTLKKAIGIVEDQPEPDYLERARLLVALGDVYTRLGKYESSDEHYTAAWNDLSRDDAYLDERDAFFGEPVRVSGGRFATLEFRSRGEPEESLRDGFIVVRYTVTEKGQVADISIIESEPAGLMDRSILTTYRRSNFRPMRVDGVAAPTTNKISRHEFKYATSVLKAIQREQTEAAQDADATERPSRDADEPLEYPPGFE